MPQYAAKTEVDSARSVAEIERTISRYGASGYAYAWQSEPPRAVIEFEMRDRRVRFVLPLPDRKSREFAVTPSGRSRTAASSKDAYEQAVRQRWRALALIVKAKLEAVESKVVTFEEEFALHFVMADGRTVADELVPRLPEICSANSLPALMPPGR
jgi:hypothetical protein